MEVVAIVGAHGLYANYGGWDQLVKNLAELKSKESFEYLIFNSSQSPKHITPPAEVKVKRINIKSSGFIGMFYDLYSILLCYFKVDTILFLGVQGMPLISILSLFKKVRIVSNMGGIEWERPKFGFLAKMYLKYCFRLALKYSDWVILDNEHYFIFVPDKFRYKTVVIPYGGEIDNSLNSNNDLLSKYPFLNSDYFLSISRSLEDNKLDELCSIFVNSNKKLVLISNFTNSPYGSSILTKYQKNKNIILINGLYEKRELDLIRRKCIAYIHTHTLCGTAPSLVEMIVCCRPIIAIDIPQNRFTLDNNGILFKDFKLLSEIIEMKSDFSPFIPSEVLKNRYNWRQIVLSYENTFFN